MSKVHILGPVLFANIVSTTRLLICNDMGVCSVFKRVKDDARQSYDKDFTLVFAMLNYGHTRNSKF